MTSNDVPRFNPQGVDPINGNLGEGECKYGCNNKFIK
jgi:hypothetical protein